MSFSMAPLLMHSPDLPAAVRDRLRAAQVAEPAGRTTHLLAAARMMHEQLAVACRDACELVGLDATTCAASAPCEA